MTELFEVKDLSKSYGRGANKKFAIKDITLDFPANRSIGIVGESGSGKSTLARCLVGLLKPDSGDIFYKGKSVSTFTEQDSRKFRQEVQMVFQDPLASLNLRQSAKQAMIEILKFKHPQKRTEEYEQIAVELLRKVGFDDRLIEARPRQMSGGQRQRLCIAKALATEPKVLILDEAVAALDPLIQKQILDLLKEIQQSEGLIYLFITHNLDVARSMADVSIYLNEGKMAEIPESWSV
jgi:ABC-type glutathione transport system ATPase component